MGKKRTADEIVRRMAEKEIARGEVPVEVRTAQEVERRREAMRAAERKAKP